MKFETVSCVEAINRSLNNRSPICEAVLVNFLTPIFGEEVKDSIEYLIKTKSIERCDTLLFLK